MNSFIRLLLVCLIVGAGYPAAQAASNSALPMNTMPLSKLVGQIEPIDLRGVRTIYPIFIPLSRRLSLEKVVLHLEYVNSIALVGERSQLVVKLNEDVVAQLPLNPKRPEGVADIRLPSSRFKPGYNKITLYVAQHYTYECEDPDAPELWTQIDSQNSYVKFEGGLNALNPRLSEIEHLFDKRWLGNYELNIQTASGVDAESARWGAMVSQAAALHLEYKSPLVRHSTAEFNASPTQRQLKNYRFPYLKQSSIAGKDTVLIGTHSDLQPLLGSNWSRSVDGPYLAVYPQDEDSRHFLLIVSGQKEEDVAVAAKILGYMNFPLPDTRTATFPGLKMDHLPRFATKDLAATNNRYRFYDLGFESMTMRGAGGGSTVVDISLPPDVYVAQTSEVKLNLHFAYGAGMRGDSVFNIFINGRFENVIRLKEIEGEAVRRHSVTIPTRSFKPGRNEIMFAAQMITNNSEECQVRNDQNLLFTLYDDSTIEFKGLDSYVQMPNLKLTAKTGFPYNYYDDAKPTVIGMGTMDSELMGASWTFLGKMAQVMTRPHEDLTYRIGGYGELGDANLIVMGPVKSIDQNLLDRAPIQLGDESVLTFGRAAEIGDHPRLNGSRLWINADEYGDQNFNYVRPSLQGYGLGDYGVMMQFGGGRDYGETVTLLTAMSSEILYGAITDLVTPEIWSNVQGDVTAWKQGEEFVYARTFGEKYYVGEPRFSNWLIYHFSNNPVLFIIFLIFFLVLLAVFIRWLLKRFRENNH